MRQNDWLAAEADRLIDFALGSRHPDGGFAWLDDTGRPMLDQPAELWITCRMTHVFSLGRLLGRPDCAELVDHGISALLGRFRDPTHGGWYAAVDSTGPVQSDKETYGHAFVVLAASSAAASGHPDARGLLDEALAVFQEHLWSEADAMVVDRWDASFSRLDPYRGINANMHTVEAFMAASDVTGDPQWRDKALQIVERVMKTYAPQSDWRLPEHFDDGWSPLLEYNADQPQDKFRPYGATPGHGLEWSRLTLNLRAALGDSAPDWMLPAAQSLFDRAVADGWSPDPSPGFVYTTDWSGKPVVRERFHWVAAEATSAASALGQATGDARYAKLYELWWAYIQTRFIDLQGGSWWHELDPDNRPSAKVWAGKPDVYHALQATLAPRLPLAPTYATALSAQCSDRTPLAQFKPLPEGF